MFVLLFAAHEGEELVVALPAIMLAAAVLLLKWAASNESSSPDENDLPAEEEPEVSLTR
jgi:hypothetical protein